MRLNSFRVRTFRNIVDSGPVQVDEVTCVVGKNEAGKSALLQALHHLNPAKPQVSLDLLDEYPRWLKKEHEITGEIKNAVPIEAEFEMSAADVEALADQFGEGVVGGPTVLVRRTYAEPGTIGVEVPIDHARFIADFLTTVSDRLRSAVNDVKNAQDMLKRLDSTVAGRTEEDVASQALAADAETAKAALSEQLGGVGSLTGAVHSAIRAMVPRTFYFSTYSQLDGRYPLDQVFHAVKNGSDDEEVQAAADFLELARVVPEQIEDWDFEASNAELESISSLLTQRVRAHWKQNDHLKLKVFLETQPITEAGVQQVQRFLQFRVEDTRHDFSSRLDRRSTGFRWFVSFMASFLEFESDTNLVLLLDEPGLSLHARAQMDLLDTIEAKLAANRQVLYSTHSPFMVKTARLGSVRITEDQGPQVGSVVINDAGVVADPDTLFPLQAALGYDVVQSVFIGNRNVLLEGVSDFIYIEMFSELLRARGRESLSEGTRLLPAGGATNIPTFIALLGGHLEVVVLLDGNTDRQRIEGAIARGRLDEARVMSMDQFCDVKQADIEDLFEAAEYLALYNGAFNKSLKLTQLKGRDRIVKRIARADDGDFDHGVVAAHFLRNLTESLDSVSAETVGRFEALVAAVNAALPD